eukprot:NODE_12_length_54577_cov_0.384100.p1 type:complete len:1039 gc:universal NODE_12_length_54577_cov_0.384100:24666-27782(+)
MLLATLLLATIKVFQSHFEINGKATLLRGGSLQWYRLPKSEWEDRLLKFKAVGYNMVEIYVSWQYIEPIQNQFHLDDLQDFLEMCKRYNLYVYIRPGPFICNEENAGGYPNWVIAQSDKIINPDSLDGKYSLRSDDLDFLVIVKSYFKAINRIIKPFQISHNGTIILYQVENEFDYYMQSLDVDRYAWIKDHPERPYNQTININNYFNHLNEFIREDGIDVPSTTCPGTLEMLSMPTDTTIIPLPNYYSSTTQIETNFLNYKLVQNQNKNLVPAGTSETFRASHALSRMILSGMDLVSQFNTFGHFAHGHHHSTILQLLGIMTAADLPKMFHQLFHPPSTGKIVAVPIALFPSQMDLNGIVSPSGQIRNQFFHIHLLNIFYNTFEYLIAPVNMPYISYTNKRLNKAKRSNKFPVNDEIFVKSSKVGALDTNRHRFISWMPLNASRINQTILIGILNPSSEDIELPPHSIQTPDFDFPLISKVTIPSQYINTLQIQSDTKYDSTDTMYVSHLIINLIFIYHFYFSTIPFTYKRLLESNEKKSGLIALHNKPDTEYEILMNLFDIPKPKNIPLYKFKKSDSFKAKGNYILLYGSVKNTPVIHHLPNLTILILNTFLASRLYNHKVENKSIDFIGVDLLLGGKIVMLDIIRSFYTFQLFEKETDLIKLKYPILSSETTLNGMLIQYDLPRYFRKSEFEINGPFLSEFSGFTDFRSYNSPLPYIEQLQLNVTNERTELDSLNGPLNDYTEYSTDISENIQKLFADSKKPKKVVLVFERLGDFACFYLNDKPLECRTPLMMMHKFEIDSNHFNLKDTSKYILKIVVSIWGRGNFMFPSGDLGHIPYKNKKINTGIHFNMVILACDGLKGVFGNTTLNGSPLRKFNVSSKFARDSSKLTRLNQYSKSDAPRSVQVKKGELKWVSYFIKSKHLMTTSKIANSIKLKGQSLKANLYINNIVIGKFISDEGFIQDGNGYDVDSHGRSLADTHSFPVVNFEEGFQLDMLLDGRRDGAVLEEIKVEMSREIYLKDGSKIGQIEYKFDIE